MPLLDHFRLPIWKKGSWEGFHGMWPAMIVVDLCKVLPSQYTAEPRVHLGTQFEIDVCAFEPDDSADGSTGAADESGAAAIATWAPPQPTLAVDVDPVELYEYEVLIYDESRGRELVAAIEIASPANKDRAETRQAFTAKCAGLLQQKVCVSIVDLVTTRNFNLYCDLLDIFCQTDPAFAPTSPATYAVTCRSHQLAVRSRFETWAYPLIVGEPLPILPIWLDHDLAISLNLEESYTETCRVLRLI